MYKYLYIVLVGLLIYLPSCSTLDFVSDNSSEIRSDNGLNDRGGRQRGDNNLKEYTLYDYGREWLDSLCCPMMGGRYAGSMGDHLAYNYIHDLLEGMGYHPITQEFRANNGCMMRNLLVMIPGGG